jgi:hypothetical protein
MRRSSRRPVVALKGQLTTMRNLLPCLALAAFATVPFTSSTAEACGGGYESNVPSPPQVTLVQTHRADLSTPGERFGTRSFALLGTSPTLPQKPVWKRLMTTSYDPTEVTQALTYYVPTTLTLLGPSGARIVKSHRRVALKNALWQADSVFDAVELRVPSDETFTVAILGDHSGAVWHDIEGSYTWTNKIKGTSLSITRKHDGNGTQFTLTNGKRTVGSYSGTVMGAIDVDGLRYLVVASSNGMASALAVPMT